MAGGTAEGGHYQYNASMLPIADKLLVPCENFVVFTFSDIHSHDNLLFLIK